MCSKCAPAASSKGSSGGREWAEMTEGLSISSRGDTSLDADLRALGEEVGEKLTLLDLT